MTESDPSPSRNKERTRRAILDAAAQMLSTRGSKVSLADIAQTAGVTPGGLRHHFPSRKTLLRGVVEDSIERLWDEIHEHVDLSENRPGKLLRGYIRALTGDSDVLASVLDPTGLSAALGHPAEFEDLWLRDAERWIAALSADGLPKARVLVIQHAAEGLAVARSGRCISEDSLALARAELLAMTERTLP